MTPRSPALEVLERHRRELDSEMADAARSYDNRAMMKAVVKREIVTELFCQVMEAERLAALEAVTIEISAAEQAANGDG